MALAARLMQQQQIADTQMITKLLEAANQNMQQLTAAVQEGVGQTVDIMA